ncbi:hypothetical protein PSTG_11420 [Puccinia striiformis f. sp. tritici PST-78]|uniref:Uncharacterized protein n=1 Tax=Puccinia striiformis f. sp. tritici PST-78 TaxID=1165861 RepID=A0A0L0V8C7_9BASI|nr:hypothetical protein PSTG_11420 [Puccinia striiformis f. sp. tritici PST-78]
MNRFFIVFFASYLGCNAMNDFSSGPIKAVVEKTADEQTFVDKDQADPIWSQRNIPARNPNRYMTNGGGSCEDPDVTVLLPSAPNGGVFLRSSHLVPPVWFTENLQDGTPKGHIEKQYGTAPRALPAELKRKRPDTHSRISGSECQTSAVFSPLGQVETIAQRRFKLFGFLVKPEGYAKKCKGVERMEDPAEIKTTPIPGSLSEADSSSKDMFIAKQHVDASSSSLSVTPKPPSIGPVSGQATVRARKNTTGPEVQLQVSIQDQTTANTKLRRLKFDVDLFKSFASLTSNGGVLPPKLTALFRLGGGSELVMTEDEFVRYSGTAFQNYKLPNAAEIHPEKTFSQTSSKSRLRNQSAIRFLGEHLAPWISRYEEKLKINWLSFIRSISGTSHKTVNSGLEKLIVSYFNFVEMISTVVPRDKQTNDINLELKKSFELLESIYETKEPHELPYHPALESQRSVIKEKLFVTQSTDNLTRLWVLLDIWLETFRNRLFQAMKRSGQSGPGDNFMKRFFWTTFFVSIKPFTAQLED